MVFRNAIAVVANYGLHGQASALRKELEKLMTTIIIDSDSGVGFPEAEIQIKNTGYPGLWNTAYDELLRSEKEWLFFIASDVELRDCGFLETCLSEILDDESVSMWSPSVSHDSRASFSSCRHCITPSVRECGAIEGFCFLVRKEVLVEQGRIPSWMSYGHGVDMITSVIAHRKGVVLVDDRLEIYHPRSKHELQIDKCKKEGEFIRLKNQYQISRDELLYIDNIERIYESRKVGNMCIDTRKALILAQEGSPYPGGYDCQEVKTITLTDDLDTLQAKLKAISAITERDFSDVIVSYLLPKYITARTSEDLLEFVSEISKLTLAGGIIVFVLREKGVLDNLWGGIEGLEETEKILTGKTEMPRIRAAQEELKQIVKPLKSVHTTEGLCIVLRCIRMKQLESINEARLGRQEAFRSIRDKKPQSLESYGNWYQKDKSERVAYLLREEDHREAPLSQCISVLMPVFNTKKKWLEEAIDSVINQIYSNWRLVIVDDCSSSNEVIEQLRDAAQKDKRISIIYRDSNGGIAAASNTGLKNIETEWVALLDHDDVLAEDALLVAAGRIAKSTDAMLLYSDEDKINEEGVYVDPYFKSDWDPIQMEGHNMVSHLGIYKTAHVLEIGGFRSRFDGAQDYDMTLRYVEGIDKCQIHHIPHVLYHWRQHEGSTSLNIESKPAIRSGIEVLREYCERSGIESSGVVHNQFGYQIQRGEVVRHSRVTIIVPTRDRLDLLERCIESLTHLTDYKDYEILIIDNESTEAETVSYFNSLVRDKRAIVKRIEGEFNYSRLMNLAVGESTSDFICFLNNDTEIINPNWLGYLVTRFCSRNDIGAVGAKLIYEDRRVQHGGVILGAGGVAGHAHVGLDVGSSGYFGKAVLAHEVSAVTAACLLISRALFHDIGGFNESDLPVAFNDVDLCLRLGDKGLKTIYEPEAVLIHHESASRSIESISKNPKRKEEADYMVRKWGHLLENDPCYNPNLSLARPYTVDPRPRHPYSNR